MPSATTATIGHGSGSPTRSAPMPPPGAAAFSSMPTAWPATSISRSSACGRTGGRRRADRPVRKPARSVGFDGGRRLGHGRQEGARRAVPRLGLRRLPLDGGPARGSPALDSRPRGGDLCSRRVLRLPGAWSDRATTPARTARSRRSLGRAGSTTGTRTSTWTPSCWASSRWRPDEPGLSLALWRRTSPPSLILHVINRQAEEASRSIGLR